MAIVLITRHYVLMSWWHYVQVWKVRGPTLDTQYHVTLFLVPKWRKRDVPLFSVGDTVAGPDFSHHPPSCIRPHVSWDQWWKEWRRSKSKNDQTQVFLLVLTFTRGDSSIFDWVGASHARDSARAPGVPRDRLLLPRNRVQITLTLHQQQGPPHLSSLSLVAFPRPQETGPVKPATPEKPSETWSAARWNFRFEVSEKRLHFVKSFTAVDKTAPLRTNIYICIEGWKYCQNAFPGHQDRQLREGERQRVRVGAWIVWTSVSVAFARLQHGLHSVTTIIKQKEEAVY